MTDETVAPGPVGPAPTNNNAEMQAQEQLLKAKYGGLLPKKKLVPRDQKYFDSADWQMNKQQQGDVDLNLQPKLQPSERSPRRSSQLGDGR